MRQVAKGVLIHVAEWADTIVRANKFTHTTHRPIFGLVNLMGG